MATFKMILIQFLLYSLTFNVTKAYKWYLNFPGAHEVQKRHQDLWEYGCCQDTIGCHGNGPKYLGMDVFMRMHTLRATYDAELEDDVLMIHQINYMVSKVFGSDSLPSEVSIGRIGKPIDDDLWAKKLDEFCPHKDGTESRFITGFSVQASDEGFLVCEDIVLFIRLQDTQIISTKNRTKICPCQDRSSGSCQGLHPIFCDNDSGKLMSIAAVPTKVNDKNPYLYGFYSTHSKHETATTSRKYSVKVWRYQQDTNDPIHVTSSTGYLTEVDTFKEDETGYYGMYFTNDGNACPFNGTYLNDTQIKDLTDLTFEYLNTPRQPCLSFQIFIGCPQPWCFSNKIDASFTLEDKNGKDSYIIFAVGNFMWKVKDTGLLLKTPRVEDANKPIFKKGTDVNSPNLNPCKDFLADAEMISCAVPNIGAAFAWKRDLLIIFYYSTSLNKIIISEAWSQISFVPKDENLLKPDSNETNFWYDAFWPNVKEKLVYGFIGRKYEKFNGSADSIELPFLGVTGQLNEFHIEVPLVDAVVNPADKGYFFYNNFYYEVPEDSWRNQASPPKIFAMANFFNVRKECYANHQKAYETLVSRFIQKEYAVNKTVIDDVILSTGNTQESSTESPRSRMYIAVISIIIVIGVLVGIFIFGTKPISKVYEYKTLAIGSPLLKSSPKAPKSGGKNKVV